jgi:two-component system KDP operon response regulator KdpE
MGSGRILVVDDDPDIRDMLKEVLDEEGWETSTAAGGREAIAAVEIGLVDLLMLDLMMPGVNGFEVLETIRKFSTIPIIIITALTSDADKARCLKLGADDYIAKAFDLDDLRFRVRAAFARRARKETQAFQFDYGDGYLAMDFDARRVTAGGVEVRLEAKEYDLLHALVTNAGKALTREQLLTGVWGSEYRNDQHILDKYISSLRGKIERDPRNPQYIVTVPRVGYRFQTASMQAPQIPRESSDQSAAPTIDYQI